MSKERNKADSYREKAYQGDTKAMNNLGVCYERGIGVKVCLGLAFEWYIGTYTESEKLWRSLLEW